MFFFSFRFAAIFRNEGEEIPFVNLQIYLATQRENKYLEVFGDGREEWRVFWEGGLQSKIYPNGFFFVGLLLWVSRQISNLRSVKNLRSTKQKSSSRRQLVTFGWLILNF
jgi:hypothetical protein